MFGKKKVLDLLQEKEAKLEELTVCSNSAIKMVQDTISNLERVNEDIENTMNEIDTYLKRLSETRSGLDSTRGKNQQIMQNFSKLLCID